MTEFNIVHRPPNEDNRRTILLLSVGDAVPENFESIGSAFDLADDGKVRYHYIRDALYHEGVQNMQDLDIQFDGTILPSNLVLSTNAVTVEESSTVQVIAALSPGNATNGDLVVVSDDTDTATVTVNQETRVITITGVAEGTCDVTVSDDETGDLEEIIAVTVTAPA